MVVGTWRALGPGGALTRWSMTAPEETPFPGIARPMPDHVDYRFVNGAVDTGDFPCREALRAMLPNRTLDRPTGPFDHVHTSGDTSDVDFSRFCFTPTLIARAFRAAVRAPVAAAVRFRVSTCGGVAIWADDAEVLRFEPFERNRPQATTFALGLGPEPTLLTLRLEDLHERDTTCFFSMIAIEGSALETALDGVDAAALDDALDAMNGLRTERVFYRRGPITLVGDHPPAGPLALRLEGWDQFPRGGLTARPEPMPPLDRPLGPDPARVVLFDAGAAPTGCLKLEFAAAVGAARLSRTLGVTCLPPMRHLSGATLVARKAEAAAAIADHAAFEPSVALLLLARKVAPERAARIVEAALDDIERRRDCADFSMLPILRIGRDHRSDLPAALDKRLKAAILGFRYWLDEPGDDVMWFWSENHVLCFHVAQLVAGALFPEAVFTNGGKSGRRMQAEARVRLGRWFDSIDTHGLAEWNSAAYYPIDMLGLLTLHDIGGDAALAARAARTLDLIFVMTGLHTLGGVPAGSQGRAYEKELLAGPATELGAVAAVAFGGAWPVGYDRAAALFCLSDYAPPADAAGFARPGPGRTLAARYTQGLDHAARLSLWKCADVQLSTVSDHESGRPGKQEHVLDVQFAGHPMARAWINHPGELKPWGERRPSLLAGNGVLPRLAQCGPMGLLIYDLDGVDASVAFSQLFAPADAFDEVIAEGQGVYLRSGRGFAAIWCSVPLERLRTGLYRDALWRAPARRAAWTVHVACATAALDFEAFRRRDARVQRRFDAARRRLRVAAADGRSTELNFDGPLIRDGSIETFQPLSAAPHFAWSGAPLRAWAAS